jgi:hypothetical protein
MSKKDTVLMLNGYEVSIQQSEKHYCGSNTVEVAVIKDDKFLDTFPHARHGVAGWVTAPQLADILMWVSVQGKIV